MTSCLLIMALLLSGGALDNAYITAENSIGVEPDAEKKSVQPKHQKKKEADKMGNREVQRTATERQGCEKPAEGILKKHR